MTTEPEPNIEAAPSPAPVIRPAPEAGERLPQMIERTRRRGRRRRAPVFTPQEVATIDYKDVDRLRKLISDRGRIEPRRKTGLTAKDQRKIAREIKRARQVALLPYTAEHMRQTSRFRMVTRMAQRAMRAELDDAPPSEAAPDGAEAESAASEAPAAAVAEILESATVVPAAEPTETTQAAETTDAPQEAAEPAPSVASTEEPTETTEAAEATDAPQEAAEPAPSVASTEEPTETTEAAEAMDAPQETADPPADEESGA